MPWWVPVLCFGVILVTMVLRRAGERAESGGEEESGVAGRIGQGMGPRDEAP